MRARPTQSAKLCSLVVLSLFLAIPISARTKFYGYAERGNQTVITALTGASAKAQASYPNCQIAVFVDNTSTPATIYSDSIGTVLPGGLLHADSTGYFYFWGDSATYSVKFSPSGVTPWTLAGFGSSGGGNNSDGSNSVNLCKAPYNAKCDGRTGTFSITNGSFSATMVSGAPALANSDVGKPIVIYDAGGIGLALATTIAAVNVGTQVATLNASASATVVAAYGYIATDDTAIAQSALDANTNVVFSGSFGFTTLRINYGQSFHGESIGNSRALRIGLGTGGPAIAVKSGTLSQGVNISDFEVRCGQLGTNVNCVELGTEDVGGGYAFGSVMRNIRAWDATGATFKIKFNAAVIDNLWCDQNAKTFQSTVAGLWTQGSNPVIGFANVEGNYPGGPVLLAGGGVTKIGFLQLEVGGNNPSVDIVGFFATGQNIENLYVFGSGTYRDVIRVSSGTQFIEAAHIFIDPTHPTYTNTVNDLQNSFASGVTGANYTYRSQDSQHPRAWILAPPPAGAAANDGLLVIGDGGAGLADLVAYKGGQKFRVPLSLAPNLPVFANNAAAIAGGLTAGAFYRTGADPDPVMVVH